jgi:surface antigen
VQQYQIIVVSLDFPMRLSILAVCLAACAALAGCMPAAAPVASAPTAPAGPPPVTGWLAGPVGQLLDAPDRERAFAAQLSAAETGQRASWRSARGHFGFVEPGPEKQGASGPCRSFSHAIYIDGRAQRGEGSACRTSSGAWMLAD